MAHKDFALDDRTTITIYKRSSSRSLRLSIAADGQIRVSIPKWAPYRAGLEFAKSKRKWIEEQRKPSIELTDGQAIGKAHHLHFNPSHSATTTKGRVQNNQINITYPDNLAANDVVVQTAAQKACIRALRTQADQLLPIRLKELATKHNFEYASVTVKNMKSRWGSCDQRRNIVLNIYLVQLPWELIDYVLLHELTHTKVLKHGPVFWAAMTEVLPDVKERRKQVLNNQPILNSPMSADL